MSKKSEDSLENFFRKAAGQHDPTFLEKDWHQMEKMLDERAAAVSVARRAKIKRVGAYAAAVLMLASTIYFTAIDQGRPLVGPDDSLQQQQVAAGSTAPPPIDEKNEPTAGLLPSLTDAANHPSRISSEEAGASKAVAQTRTLRPGTGILANATSRKEADDTMLSSPPEAATNAPFDEQPSVISTADKSPLGQANRADTDATSGETRQEKEKEESPPSLTTESEPDQGNKTKPDDNTDFAPRWSFSMVVAPDFSTTALNGFTSPGGAYGLTVGYRVSRFTFNTGVLKSSKKYEGYGNEYQPPEGYWVHRTNGVVPAEIYGTCEVVEVPLIVQYTFRDRVRSRAFVSAGLSTYMMLDERYTYRFRDPNPGADNGWASDGTTSYPWAVGHFSVGFERKLNTRLSIGLEPFLKVPFGAIGWSGIELFTTGAYVNFRYSIAKRSSVSGKE